MRTLEEIAEFQERLFASLEERPDEMRDIDSVVASLQADCCGYAREIQSWRPEMVNVAIELTRKWGRKTSLKQGRLISEGL